MNAFFGYNQKQMAPENKTTFITDHGLFYYRIMPFRLMNTNATNQWLANRIFKDQIIHNMMYVDDMLYVDDILVKSRSTFDCIADFKEASTLCQYKMKLNPVKYAFKVTSKKFLDFMISRRGIENNLEKK